MCYHSAMQTFTWNDIPEDILNPLAGRKALHGANITVARFRFDKGNVVAMHHHINDQITIIQSGKVRFNLDGDIKELSAGDFLHVAPDIPHGNEALEDTVIIELFSPIREDWIKGDDSYLRKK
jgi:quercetin dioxygenase-like cupin family protein